MVAFVVILVLIKLYVPKDDIDKLQQVENSGWVLEGKRYKFKNTVGDVWVMHGPVGEPNKTNTGFMNNPAVIVANDGLIVVDPGSTYSVGMQIIKQIEKISSKPILAVFNTHIHGDHWLGNQAIIAKYPNAKIYAHNKMILEAKDGEGDRWVDLMKKLTDGLAVNTVATYPTNDVKHQQIISISNKKFRIHKPTIKAHTDTDIMIESIDDSALFLGDNDFSHRMARFDNSSSMLGNIKTLEYAIDLNLASYTPGHGQTGAANIAVKPFLDYLKIVRTGVQEGYGDDLADFEIKPILLAKVQDYQSWHGFNTQFGKHIGKMYLEVEALDL